MKKIIFLLVFLIAGLTANAETYYVKNGGNNASAGTSHATAWATIAKVNATAFAPGDSVLFRCNDIWREYITFSPPAGTAGGRVYYGSYQTGNKPLFLGSKEENLETDWVDQTGNIWKSTDAQFDVGYGVGNLIFNNETSTGYKEANIANLNAQGDWYWDDVEKSVSLYSTINPALYYTDIECALDRVIIGLAARDYITLDGLDIRYGGQHGISGSTGNDNITIQNCHISYMGGSEFPDATARYGNGIQFWKGATNILIQKNVIEQIYDDGITPQYDGADGVYTVSMSINYNVINYTRISINIFERAVSSTIAINIYNNTMMNAGLEWSSDGQRPDPAFGARHIRLAGITGTISSFNIKNNIFYEADMTCFYGYGSTPLASFDIDNNLYFNSIGTIAQIEDTPYTTLAAWQTASSQEAASVTGNPLFTSSTNFYLQATSPARNVGADVSLTSDIAGIVVPQETAPEIGAYEYLAIPVATTGLGWQDILHKRNYKDVINFDNTWMINGIPVTATASELNALVGQGEIISGIDTLSLSNRIDRKVNIADTTGVASGSYVTPTQLNDTIAYYAPLASPTLTGTATTNNLHVDGSAQFGNTGLTIDSIGLVDNRIAFYDGPDTLGVHIIASDIEDLGNVTYLLGDTLASTNPGLYTQRQVDSIMASVPNSEIYRIAFKVDTTLYAPKTNDSIYTDSRIANKHIEVWRGGNAATLGRVYNESIVTATNYAFEYTAATGKITFHPKFTTGEKVIIEASDTTKWTTYVPLLQNAVYSEYYTIYNLLDTKPTGDTIIWQSDLVYSLDSAGLWDRVKLLYMPVAASTLADSYHNWAAVNNTSDYTATVGDAPAFDRVVGWDGNGSSDYLNSGLVLGTDSTLVNHSEGIGNNDLTIGVWCTATTKGNTNPLGVTDVAYVAINMILYSGSDTFSGYVNDASGGSLGANATGSGFSMLTRRAHGEKEGYRNGVSTGTDNDESVRLPITQSLYLLANNDRGSAAAFHPDPVAIIIVMDAVSDDESLAIYNIFHHYMTHIGL